MAEGDVPVSVRDLTACPDEPLYADPASRDFSSSRTASATQARATCPNLVLLGQATGSGILLDTPPELTDVVRATQKICENRHHLLKAPAPSTP
ncbi:hypothetical protein V2W30_33255 [Streptomyces sp. Q6]|uniref:Uncharacterized protein n=1 Tax=Streptomyces citrinus TaxID=3118173 RepID=A0ACD5AKE3_9ACTN